MKPLFVIAMVFCTLTFFSVMGNAQTAASASQVPAPLPEQLFLELKTLKLELLQQKVEFQQWKIQQLEREFRQAQLEQDRLIEHENLIRQQLAELRPEPTVSSGTLESGAGSVDALRTQLSNETLPELQSRREPITERISQLTRQLNQEEAQLHSLLDQIKKLQAKQ